MDLVWHRKMSFAVWLEKQERPLRIPTFCSGAQIAQNLCAKLVAAGLLFFLIYTTKVEILNFIVL